MCMMPKKEKKKKRKEEKKSRQKHSYRYYGIDLGFTGFKFCLSIIPVPISKQHFFKLVM